MHMIIVSQVLLFLALGIGLWRPQAFYFVLTFLILYILMISGFILTLAGLIWLPLAQMLAWPVHLLLTYIVKVIDYLSAIPLAAYEFDSFSWIFLIAYYLILAIVIKTQSKPKVLSGQEKTPV